MDMFKNIDISGAEEQVDYLGGGSFTVESGLYDGVIKLAYVTPSAKSQAKCVVTVIAYGDKEITDRTWIFNRNGDATYEKDGKTRMLPGFETINDLCLVSTGFPLAEQTVEEKVIKVWDSQSKSEVNKNMPVITSLLGKKVSAAILKVTENKQEKVGDSYVDTNESRDVNETDKYFHTETKKTYLELKKDADIAEADLFYTKWGDKNSGQTRNKFKEVTGSSGAPKSGTGSPKATKSLFG